MCTFSSHGWSKQRCQPSNRLSRDWSKPGPLAIGAAPVGHAERTAFDRSAFPSQVRVLGGARAARSYGADLELPVWVATTGLWFLAVYGPFRHARHGSFQAYEGHAGRRTNSAFTLCRAQAGLRIRGRYRRRRPASPSLTAPSNLRGNFRFPPGRMPAPCGRGNSDRVDRLDQIAAIDSDLGNEATIEHLPWKREPRPHIRRSERTMNEFNRKPRISLVRTISRFE